jgi:hypothetical protein
MMHAELAPHGLTVITVALDADPARVRPFIAAAKPSHPSLVDTEFRVAELYNMHNVPTTVWIDEKGRIARPNDAAYVTDTFTAIHGIRSEPVIEAIRGWAHGRRPAMTDEEVRRWQQLPDEAQQSARAEFAVARWLAGHGFTAAAEAHFVRAGDLAPHDFTIRRGSMPIRGVDPMGEQFVAMARDWAKQGRPYYRKLPDDVGG